MQFPHRNHDEHILMIVSSLSFQMLSETQVKLMYGICECDKVFGSYALQEHLITESHTTKRKDFICFRCCEIYIGGMSWEDFLQRHQTCLQRNVESEKMRCLMEMNLEERLIYNFEMSEHYITMSMELMNFNGKE